MNTNASAREVEALTKRFVHQATVALICLSIAWFFLTVGVFTFYPLSIAGLICLAIGLVFMITSITYFVRYELTGRKVRKITR